MNAKTKTTYYLEMLHPGDLRPKTVQRPGLRVERMTIPCPEYNKFLHTVIGYPHRDTPADQPIGRERGVYYLAAERLIADLAAMSARSGSAVAPLCCAGPYPRASPAW